MKWLRVYHNANDGAKEKIHSKYMFSHFIHVLFLSPLNSLNMWLLNFNFLEWRKKPATEQKAQTVKKRWLLLRLWLLGFFLFFVMHSTLCGCEFFEHKTVFIPFSQPEKISNVVERRISSRFFHFVNKYFWTTVLRLPKWLVEKNVNAKWCCRLNNRMVLLCMTYQVNLDSIFFLPLSVNSLEPEPILFYVNK